jgi:hypothetical protein
MIPTETDKSAKKLVSKFRSRGVVVDVSEIYEIPYSLD